MASTAALSTLETRLLSAPFAFPPALACACAQRQLITRHRIRNMSNAATLRARTEPQSRTEAGAHVAQAHRGAQCLVRRHRPSGG
jgi:hypothetical protein